MTKRREQIQAALALVEGKRESLTTSPPDPGPQLAAAGLMRCCLLLRGICALEDAGLAALAGILERLLWETWLVSLYVLLGGKDAVLEVAGDDIVYKRLLSDKLDLKLQYHPHWDGDVRKLNHANLAERLGPLLAQAGETGHTSAVPGYNVTYRVQSTFAVHANLSTIGAHLAYGEESWGVQLTPPAGFPAIGLTSVLHLLHLSGYVFKTFGIPTADIDHLGEAVLEEARKQNREG